MHGDNMTNNSDATTVQRERFGSCSAQIWEYRRLTMRQAVEIVRRAWKGDAPSRYRQRGDAYRCSKDQISEDVAQRIWLL